MATFEFKMPAEQANRGTTWDSGIYEQVDFSPIPNVRAHITIADYESDSTSRRLCRVHWLHGNET